MGDEDFGRRTKWCCVPTNGHWRNCASVLAVCMCVCLEITCARTQTNNNNDTNDIYYEI